MKCYFAVVFLTYLRVGYGRPDIAPLDVKASFIVDPHIVGGQPASPGEFPHQLALHTSSNPSSSLRCGAVLLSALQALTAGHCVDGMSPGGLFITAGLYLRNDLQGSQTRQILSYVVHENYCGSCDGFPFDIAILNFVALDMEPDHVGGARLPDNNDNDMAGNNCVISGWGRTSSSTTLPQALYKGDIQVLFNDECAARMQGISGASIYPQHICLFDRDHNTGSCNGDSGGPLNCPNTDPEDPRQHIVAGLTSWGISSSGDCLQDYPSVYVRTAFFLDWIAEHTHQ